MSAPRAGEQWADGRPLRLNIGCGAFCLPHELGWLNLDGEEAVAPDVVCTVPPIPWPSASVAEIYMGHLLEHFTYDDGQALLRECARVLQPGARLAVVVPNLREILQQYLMASTLRAEGANGGRWWRLDDLDDVCAYFLYATDQRTPHRWAYDAQTLERALARAGFTRPRRLDPYTDPRLSTPQFYNLGIQAVRS